MMNQFVLLLRGINVGGNNIIRMEDLRGYLADIGLSNVRTYIQSGNVVFESDETDAGRLEQQIEEKLFEVTKSRILTVVLSEETYERVLHEIPAGFGSQPDLYRYDVCFFKGEVFGLDEIHAKCVREGVDEVYSGSHAIYYRRLIAENTKSKMDKLISLKVYQSITIRNWNTTNKLSLMLKS